MVCAAAGWMFKIGHARIKVATSLNFMVFFLLAACSGASRVYEQPF
jgi:hypothetical protein